MNEIASRIFVRDNGTLPSEDKALRLLCVEDNPDDLKLITRSLSRAGYQLSLEPVDEPELFRERLDQGDYDMIISDFELNHWTAIDALAILRASGKNIPLVVVSGSLGDEAAVECIKQGATDYVLKDRMARLPSAIQRALEAKAARDEQRKAETNLRQSAEQYRMLFKGNPNPMWVFDTKNNAILAVNDAAVRDYGYSPDEFMGMSISGLWIPEDVPRILGLLEKLAGQAGPTGPIDELKHRKKNGEMIDVKVSGRPLEFQGCSARLYQAIDVTEKNSLQAQLLQSQKMESLGRLAGGVAHDLNNLMGVVLGYCDITLETFDTTSPLRHNVEAIQSAAGTAVSVVKQLLAFSRQQVRQPQTLSLSRVVRDMEGLLLRLIGEDIRLSIAVEPDLGTIEADPGQMEQVIMNLVVNARDAMPRGGQLTIRTANVAAEPRHESGCPIGMHIMLEVSDTGCGMDDKTQSRIFEPFFTTKDPGKGTGLGLATIYGIVTQSGGGISVRSELGRGSTFRVCLAHVAADPQPRQGNKQAKAIPDGSETVLLVEDSGPLREVVRMFLRESGYTVLEAEDGTAALSIARNYTSPIDLLLTDVVMPGLSGPQLAEQLHNGARSGLPVLYMSGYTDEALCNHGALEDGVALLEKPFTRGALLRKMRELLDRTEPLPHGEPF
jgi:two-component system cell cycle sensor histidine kinase/response regulator CckA